MTSTVGGYPYIASNNAHKHYVVHRPLFMSNAEPSTGVNNTEPGAQKAQNNQGG